MKVKVDKRWGKSRIKNDLMSNLENCSRDDFKASLSKPIHEQIEDHPFHF